MACLLSAVINENVASHSWSRRFFLVYWNRDSALNFRLTMSPRGSKQKPTFVKVAPRPVSPDDVRTLMIERDRLAAFLATLAIVYAIDWWRRFLHRLTQPRPPKAPQWKPKTGRDLVREYQTRNLRT
jgi:hypothetical protein